VWGGGHQPHESPWAHPAHLTVEMRPSPSNEGDKVGLDKLEVAKWQHQ
jgi:hypothetical protein